MIGGDFARVGDVVVGQHVGIGHAHGFKAEDARHLLQIDEIGVGVLRVPGEVVEGGVVDAVRAAGTDVGGRHAGVLQEGREVRAGAEVADVDLFALDGRRIGAAMLVAAERLDVPLVKNRAGHRAGNGAGDVADKLLERGHGRGGEIRTGDGDIDIEVGDGVVERAALLLDPFGRADEAFFLGIPTAEDDGAARPPALMKQSADAANGFKHGGGAAGGIDRAIDPRVAMIADDDPCVGILRALRFFR